MKRLMLIGLILGIIFTGLIAHAETACYPSGDKTADALVYKGGGTMCSLVIVTDGVSGHDCSVHPYDALSATGTAVLPVMTCAAQSIMGGVNTCVFGNINLGFFTGLYADMTVSAGSCTYNIGRRQGH